MAKIKISPRIILSISSLYEDVNRIFLEYIDNSLDSAEDFFDIKTNSYSKPIKISLEIQGSNFKTGKVVITDNCSGIPSLTKVAETIGDSEKKNNRFANGQFGFGIFSFMAACENLTIKSKYNSNDAYIMKIPKSEFEKADISNISLMDPKKTDYIYDSGTQITLSDFERQLWKDVDPLILKSEIEKHFELILKRKNLNITFVNSNQTLKCESFDYESINGLPFEREIKTLQGKKRNQTFNYTLDYPIKIYLKLAENEKLDRFPIIVKSGRRIEEIRSLKSFKSRHRSDIWGHPKLTGYVDVGDFLDPNIARVGFRNTPKSKAFFDTLLEVEAEILEYINIVNEDQSDKHYNKLEDYLNNILSKLARVDNMNFRKQYMAGDEVELEGGGDGTQQEIIEGGGKDFGTDKSTSGNGKGFGSSDGDGFGFGDVDTFSDDPGKDKGDGASNEISEFMDDDNFKGKERKRSGFNIKLVRRDPDVDVNDQLIRSQIIGSEILIFTKHPEFISRVETKRNGEEKISQRLITYLAGEITVHYKDAFYEKNKINTQYGKELLQQLVSFIYSFEDMLKDLKDKNLSELETS